MAKLKHVFGTDQRAEQDGAWMPVGEGIRFRVRSQQSAIAREHSRRALKKNRGLYQAGEIPSLEQQDEMDADLAVVLVAGWEGVEDDAGNPLPCTAETVREAVTEYPHLRRRILTFSAEMENYRAAEVKAIAGNSAPSAKPSVSAAEAAPVE